MARWYAGFQCFGRPEQIAETVEQTVINNQLASFVPIIRFEKGARGKKEFYLFLAIEGDEPGRFPPELDPLLSLSVFRGKAREHFAPSEIASMAGQNMTIQDLGRTIPYLAPPLVEDDDPLGIPDDAVADQSEKACMLTQAHSRLLSWVSARGQGTWREFYSASKSLIPDDSALEPRAIARQLRLLGHLETSRNGERWSCTPSVLVHMLLPDGHPAYVFAGQRDHHMLSVARRCGTVVVTPQPNGNGPERWLLKPANVQAALRLLRSETGSEIECVENRVVALATALPTINDWMLSLPTMSGIVPHLYEIRRYNGEHFITGIWEGKTGFYELWPLDPHRVGYRAKYTAFHNGATNQWLRGDWYGLQFLHFLVSRRRCPIWYDAKLQKVFVINFWRLPELYERVLTLCSGTLPQRSSDYLVYEAVPPTVIQLLSEKLRLDVKAFPINE